MKVVEAFVPMGGYVSERSTMSAIVQCTHEEAVGLPGLVWHGEARFTGGQYRARLEAKDAVTAALIAELLDTLSAG